MLIVNRLTSVANMTSDEWQAFGSWLQKERELADVSQAVAAEKAEMHVVHLSKIENGHSGIRRQNLLRLVDTINSLSSGHKINKNEALQRAGFASTEDTVPPELASIGFDDLDKDDLREIADFIRFRKSQKEKEK